MVYSDWNIVVIDGEEESRRLVSGTLRNEGYAVHEAADGEGALRVVRETPPHLILLDLALSDTDPRRLLRMLKKRAPDADVMLTTRQRRMPSQAEDTEVDDYIEKPVDQSDLISKVRSLEIRRHFLKDVPFIGKNEKVIQMMETVLQIAPTDIRVMITGESGTGKDLIAQAIHEHSRRKNGPFVPINCGALAEGVLESELFGHEKGAFTNAVSQRKGVFEQADSGTIFLDEVGEMPLATQVKLLRVLEQQQFLRVGGSTPIRSDARVISATNKDLEGAIGEGAFRRDLYYRLNAVPMHLPALRDRPDDIPRLIHHFITETRTKHNIEFPGFSDDAMSRLVAFEWPGNIRQLQHLIDRLAVTMKGHIIQVEDLPDTVYSPPQLDRGLPVAVNMSREELEREMLYKILWELRVMMGELPAKVIEALGGSKSVPFHLPEKIDVPPVTPPQQRPRTRIEPVATQSLGTWDELQKEAILRALELYKGNREKAAQHLGIGVRTIYRKIEKFGLDREINEEDKVNSQTY